MNRKPIAIVGGVIANKYLNGGAVWTRLNWALGFRQLGFEVYFLEQIEQDTCIDKSGRKAPFSRCENLKYFKKVVREFDLAESSALVYENGQEIYGMSSRELHDLALDANLIVNITGHLHLPAIMESPACKIYIDLDPGFTQFWYEAGVLGPQFVQHDHYFTIGEAIGSSECSIPLGDIPWKPTRQPVVLDLWPVSEAANPNRFTTVASWRDEYENLERDGQMLGLKVHEFRRFIEFPQRVSQSCEMALSMYDEDNADLNLLKKNGWVIKNPVNTVPDPLSFRKYVQESGAEFSVAKGIYTKTRSAWFSDRTVRYLASGKPALVQDTGFSKNFPVGEGLLAFDSISDAVVGAESISSDYRAHCRAARRLAETYFDSDTVLGKLVESIGLAPRA